MKLPFIGKEKLEKFSSRKYKIIVFWNTLSFISIGLQFVLSYCSKQTAIPVEIILTTTGLLNAAYLGVNLAEKKVLGNTDTTSINPPKPTDKKQ